MTPTAPASLSLGLDGGQRNIGWATPRRLWSFVFMIWAGAALLFLVGEKSLDRARASTKTIHKDAAPSIIAALEIRYLLADLDANAANYLLAAGDASVAASSTFENERLRTSGRLVEAAQNITYGDSEKLPIIALTTGIGRYFELYGEAHFRHESKDYQGAVVSYRAASDFMHAVLLPAADALDSANKSVMNDVYDAQSRAGHIAESFAVAAGGLLLAALIWAQLFLFRRMHRVVNVPLLLATGLTLVFMFFLVGRFGAASADLRTAKEDAFESIHLLWKVRAQAYDANGDESRYLLDRERERMYEESFRSKVATLTTAPTFPASLERAIRAADGGRVVATMMRGLFADEFSNITFAGEREAAIQMARTFSRYYQVDGDIRARALKRTDADHTAAVKLCLGRSNDEFARFDKATDDVIRVNQDVFDALYTQGDRGLRLAEGLDPIFAIAIALLAFVGIRARLREYA